MEDTIKILYIGSELETVTALERNEYLSVHNEPSGLQAFQWMTNMEFRAFGSQQGLECYKDIEAIVCETNLPGLNGLALFHEMQKKGLNKGLFFILIAAHPSEQLKKKSLAMGIHGYLSKPVNDKLIYDRIQYLKNFRPIEYIRTTSEGIIIEPYRTPFIKRTFDILVSAISLILLSPIFLFTIIAIRLESKGKAIYISKRVGVNFQTFDFYKFRSMYEDADQRLKEVSHLNQYAVHDNELELLTCPVCDRLPEGKLCSPAFYYDGERICENLAIKRKNANKAFWKIKDDPRATKVGKFIRNTSIDELPQLFNVLKGDMSIVGNRPLPPYEAQALTKSRWSRRFFASAGLTGLWQVEFRSRNGFMPEEERFILDNIYARKNSFWGDLLLLIRTIPVLFQKTNA